MKIALMRPEDRNGEAFEYCRRSGLEPVVAPALEIGESETDDTLLMDAISASDACIFMSATAVGKLFESERAAVVLGSRPGIRIIAVGEGTADALAARSLNCIMPSEYSSEGILDLLQSELADCRSVVVLRSDRGSPLLRERLGAAGVSISEFAMYHIGPPKDDSRLRRVIRDILSGEKFILPFSSSMMVRNFFLVASEIGGRSLTSVMEKCECWAIGAETAGTLSSYGVVNPMVARKADFLSMLRQIVENHGY